MSYASMPDTTISEKAMPHLSFYTPDPSGRVTGGFLYNHQLQHQLQTVGWQVDLVNTAYCPADVELDRMTVHLVDSLMAVEYTQNNCYHRNGKHSDNEQVVFLYHLPPFAGQSVPQQWMETERQLLQQGRIVVTGTRCFELLQARHRIEDEQLKAWLRIITPGISDNWKVKTTFSALPRKLLVLASVIPQKGIDAIINVLSTLAELDWVCHIYGETQQNPDFYQQMQQKIKALGLGEHIRLAGTVEPAQVNDLMCQADLLLNFSEFETYSMVTAEAVATGLPVLSTPVGEMQVFSQAANVQYLKDHTEQELTLQLQLLLTEQVRYLALCYQQQQTNKAKSWWDMGQQWHDFLQGISMENHLARCKESDSAELDSQMACGRETGVRGELQ